MPDVDLLIDARESALLRRLEELLRRPAAETTIEALAASVVRRLELEASEPLAWASVPLEAYGADVPAEIASSWVFVLRSNTATGAERHPNSRQRVMSYCGRGDLQVVVDGAWRSHRLSSERGQSLEGRWLSIPENAWHQAVVGDSHWVVVSFHTAGPAELIEERPNPSEIAGTLRRIYFRAQ